MPVAAFAILYWVSIKASISFILPIQKVAVLWIPNAISVAFLLLSERRRWPLYVVTLVAVYFPARVPGGALPIETYAGFCLTNTIEPLIIAGLVQWRLGGRVTGENLERALRISVPTTLFATAVAGAIAAGFLVHAKPETNYSSAAFNWMIADLFVQVMLVPAILSWALRAPPSMRLRDLPIGDLLTYAGACLLVSASFVALAADRGSHPMFVDQLFPYVSIALLIWSAFYFGLQVTTLTLMLFGSSAIMMTYFGAGPFAFEGLDAAGQILALKIGLMSVGLFSVSLAIVVSQLKRTLSELQDAKERAEAADNAKSEFLARMSHDLRTPLNSILGFAEIMKRELYGALGSQRYREYADLIYQSGEHLTNLVNDILDLARIESNEYVLTEVPIDVRQEIEASIARCTSAVAGADVPRIGIEGPHAGPHLLADRRALSQILDNLLTNAIKYAGPDAQIQAEWSLDTEMRGVLRVADTGRGIPESMLDEVTKPFVQMRGTNPFVSLGHDGVGLGLHIVSRLVALHQASLSIESDVGKGTTISITFPATRVLRGDAGADTGGVNC